MDVVDFAQDALIHHLLHRLVEGAVAPLQAGLHDLLGVLLHQRAQRVDLLRLEDQALLAEHVLPRQQCVAGDGEMAEQRRDDEYRVDVLPAQDLVVILVDRRVVADGGKALLDVFVLDVAHGDAASGVDVLQVLGKVLPAAAGADDAILHLVVGRFDLLNGGSADCGRHRGDRAGGLYKVTARNVLILRHWGNLANCGSSPRL